MRGIYEQVKQALQDIVAPELQGLKADIKRLDEKIDGVDERLGGKTDSVKNEMLSEIKRIDEKLDTAINLRERIVSLEARVESLAH